jgi:hypothetical protein
MIEILGLAILVNFWTHWFVPLQWVKDKIRWHKLPDMFMFLNCTKCLGFWSALVVTQNLYLAVATSLTSYLIENMIYFIDVKRNEL